MTKTIVSSSLISLLLFSSCATTNRGKTLQLAGVAAATGIAYGFSRSEEKDKNAALYGSALGVTAAIAGLFLFNEEKRSEEFRLKSMELQSKLDGSYSTDALSNQTSKIINQGASAFPQGDLPDEYAHLIRPGAWRLYEINRWVKRGSHRLVLESKLLEFTPPVIQPNVQAN